MRKFIAITLLSGLLFSAWAQPATDLPGWVTNIPKSNARKIYALGVSDTKMEEKDAYRLALLRAKAMLSLFHSAGIRQVVDLYESRKDQGAELNTQKLEKLSKVFSKYIVDSAQVEVVKKVYTVDQEAIVLIRENIPQVDTAKCRDTIFVESNSFLQEFKIDEASKFVKSFELGAFQVNCKQKDTLKFFYNCTDENNIDYSVTATFMDSVFTSFSTMHEYKSTTNSEIDPAEYLGFSNMKKGLWKAYFDAVMQNMISITNIMSSKTKNASDAYQNESNTGSASKDEHLFRNISNNSISVTLRDMQVFNNTLWVKMSVVSVDKSEFRQKSDKVLNLLKKPLAKFK